MRFRFISCVLFGCLAASVTAFSQVASKSDIEAMYPSLEKTYVDLHSNPELSSLETRTAATMSEGLRQLGFEVTTGVGGTGVVGLLKNGEGPVIGLRTELDALPVEEQTGLPYASKVHMKDLAGHDVPVMHACGHDVHMTSWLGTATWMSRNRKAWKGTLVMIGQPAEETVGGATGMLKAGLLTRFPKPEHIVAIHDDSGFAAGTVGYTPEYAMAAVDSVNITIYGKGGHGAMPQSTIDPVVIAARTVLALQTIASRENDPLNPIVVTVGAIHGGTKNNIIPDEVKLQLTVRTFKDEVRKKVLAAIQRITNAEVQAAGGTVPPKFEIFDSSFSTYNDPQLMRRLVPALKRALGEANVFEAPPKMVSEDFSEYGRAGVPSAMVWVGAVEPDKVERAKRGEITLPSLHSSRFAPDLKPTIETAIQTEVAMLLELMGNK